jgi:hypothetical protein
MFRWLFLYWYNSTDTPSILARFNLWSYINIKFFKTKVSTTIIYFISNLNNLSFKKLKIFYKTISYDYFYIKFLIGFAYFTVFFSLVQFI